MAQFKLSAQQDNYIPGPFLMPDVWQQEMDPMPQEYYDNRYELNNLMSDIYSKRFAGGPTMASLSMPMRQFGNTMYGAANSAGQMMNQAMGDGRRSDREIALGQASGGTPYYQQNQGWQANLPPEIASAMQQWRDWKGIGTDASKRAAFLGQYGSMPDLTKVMQYVKSVPQDLMESAKQWGLQSLDAARDARLRVNPNDIVANAQLSNKHVTNQAFNQPGAQFLFPEGNQKGNVLRAFGVPVDSRLQDWADNADSLTDELFGSSIANGTFGRSINPTYQSSGMTWGMGGNPTVYTGKGPTGAQWGQPNSGLSTPVNEFKPRNNNDPQYFPPARGAGGNRQGPSVPLNGDRPRLAQGSGMPSSSGWDSTRSIFDRTQEGAKGQTNPNDNSYMRRNDIYYGRGSDGSIAGQRGVNQDTLNGWNVPDRGNAFTRFGQTLSNAASRFGNSIFGGGSSPYSGGSNSYQSPATYQTPFSTSTNSQIYGPFAYQAPQQQSGGYYQMNNNGWIGI